MGKHKSTKLKRLSEPHQLEQNLANIPNHPWKQKNLKDMGVAQVVEHRPI
jgi:hypothetical protein